MNLDDKIWSTAKGFEYENKEDFQTGKPGRTKPTLYFIVRSGKSTKRLSLKNILNQVLAGHLCKGNFYKNLINSTAVLRLEITSRSFQKLEFSPTKPALRSPKL
jgi:hypothetical protein